MRVILQKEILELALTKLASMSYNELFLAEHNMTVIDLVKRSCQVIPEPVPQPKLVNGDDGEHDGTDSGSQEAVAGPE